MAVLRERPYPDFNFLVDLGAGNTEGLLAGFEEVILPEAWFDVFEYRNGNEKDNEVRKLTGLSHCGNLVLKRGVIGSLDLYQWFNDVRNGNQGALRSVTVQLMTEDRSAVVQTWKFQRARPVRLKWGPLHGRGREPLVEYLELAVERLEME
jgi:phage tail-like protein